MNIGSLYELYLRHPSVQTDTRKVQPGEIFFALKGPAFNGNAYAKEALEKGAAFCVVDEKEFVKGEKYILVDDVLTTLQQLAKHHREQLDIPFIAITGSNGKTTTKELVHEVLATTFNVYTTQGNLNNHIGIPLTILRVGLDADLAVIEMGANHQKEIQGYCAYTKPTHGLITNVGKAHLEGFGGEEGVRRGKGELFDYLREAKGTAFVMWDYDYLQEMSKGIQHVVKYGTEEGEVRGDLLRSDPYLKVNMLAGIDVDTINTHLVGAYNLPNVLAAVSIGKYFGVSGEKIKTAIENYIPSNSRSQLMDWKGNKVIMDAYNANPSSMKAAIENFAMLKEENKILLLGAMAELGEESLAEHAAIIEVIKRNEWKEVVLVGGDFLKIDHPYKQFANAVEAGAWLKQQQIHNASILVKGSRSMQMERVGFRV